VASTTEATMVANRARPMISITNIFEPISDSPRANVTSCGGAPSRAGQGTTTIPTASTAKAPTASVIDPDLLWYIDIGMSPAGFIMYMIMNTAMITISMIIIRMMTTAR